MSVSIKDQLNHQIAIDRKIEQQRKDALIRAAQAGGIQMPKKSRGRPKGSGRTSTTR
jgi:hypothetical protein